MCVCGASGNDVVCQTVIDVYIEKNISALMMFNIPINVILAGLHIHCSTRACLAYAYAYSTTKTTTII